MDLGFHASNVRPHLSAVPRFSAIEGPTLCFDASPTGGGALLYLGDFQADKPPDYFMYASWTANDGHALQARIGDAGSQALWEAYMLLLGVSTWQPFLAAERGPVQFRGDALGVLSAVIQKKARAPLLNLVVGETAVILCPLGQELSAVHIWSEWNVVCDLLSRRKSGEPFPPVVATAKLSTPQRREWRLLRAA